MTDIINPIDTAEKDFNITVFRKRLNHNRLYLDSRDIKLFFWESSCFYILMRNFAGAYFALRHSCINQIDFNRNSECIFGCFYWSSSIVEASVEIPQLDLPLTLKSPFYTCIGNFSLQI